MAASATSADRLRRPIPRSPCRIRSAMRAVPRLRGRYGVGRLAAGAQLGELQVRPAPPSAWPRGPGPLVGASRPLVTPGRAQPRGRTEARTRCDPAAARNLRFADARGAARRAEPAASPARPRPPTTRVRGHAASPFPIVRKNGASATLGQATTGMPLPSRPRGSPPSETTRQDGSRSRAGCTRSRPARAHRACGSSAPHSRS